MDFYGYFFFQVVLLRHVILNFHFVFAKKGIKLTTITPRKSVFTFWNNKNLWQLAQFIDTIYRNNPCTLVLKETAFQNAFIQELFCIFF